MARGWRATEYLGLGVRGAKDRCAALDSMFPDAKPRRFDVVVCWRLAAAHSQDRPARPAPLGLDGASEPPAPRARVADVVAFASHRGEIWPVPRCGSTSVPPFVWASARPSSYSGRRRRTT